MREQVGREQVGRERELVGTVIIAQEGRLHIVDDDGVGHLLVLNPKAAAETQQLRPLQARQARVRIVCSTSPDIIGLRADRIELLTPEDPA